jgi:hypothetical protein
MRLKPQTCYTPEIKFFKKGDQKISENEVIGMNNSLNEDVLKYIIGRLIENAKEASEDAKKSRSDIFAQGRNLAYYEMLDIIRLELDVRDVDLKEIGIPILIQVENKQ